MKQLTQASSQVGQASSKPKWAYNEVKIREDDIEYIRVELWDNAPGNKPIYEPKRLRAAVNFYYNTPTNMEEIKKPDLRLWGWMGNYHTFRNNQYKDSNDPHAEWYKENALKAKDLNHEYGADNVITHGNLGAVQNHGGSAGGYGPHNQPRYTIDAIQNKEKSDFVVVQLHIKDKTFEVELRNQPQKNVNRTLYSGELG
tara:strand:- start:1224 stop:1820 length:597 start_codon:yes stop_codon:yes gene_type:complete